MFNEIHYQENISFTRPISRYKFWNECVKTKQNNGFDYFSFHFLPTFEEEERNHNVNTEILHNFGVRAIENILEKISYIWLGISVFFRRDMVRGRGRHYVGQAISVSDRGTYVYTNAYIVLYTAHPHTTNNMYTQTYVRMHKINLRYAYLVHVDIQCPLSTVWSSVEWMSRCGMAAWQCK